MSIDVSENTEVALREILVELRLGGHAVGRNDDLAGAGLTSLATVDLMLAIEDRFGVEFPESMLNRRTFATLANLTAAVDTLRSAA